MTSPVKLVGREAGPASLAKTELNGGGQEPAPAVPGSAVAKVPDQEEAAANEEIRAPERDGTANNDSVKAARMPADLAQMATGGKGLTVGVVLEKGVKEVNAETGVEWEVLSNAWKEIH